MGRLIADLIFACFGLLLLFTHVQLSTACSCFPMHPQHHFCTSDFVIRAKVLGHRFVPPPLRPYPDFESGPSAEPEAEPQAELEKPGIETEAEPMIDLTAEPETEPGGAKPEPEYEVKPVIDGTVASEIKTELESGVEPIIDPTAEPEIQPEVEPEIEIEVEPQSEKVEVSPEIEVEVEVEPQSETVEVSPEIDIEVEPQSEKVEVSPEIEIEVEPEMETEIVPEVESETDENGPKTEVEPTIEPEVEPEVEPEIEVDGDDWNSYSYSESDFGVRVDPARVWKVKITKVFKGKDLVKAGDTVELWTPLDSAMCGIEFLQKHGTYLFAGSVGSFFENQLNIDMCNWLEVWDYVTNKQKKGLKNLYEDNCDCEMITCLDHGVCISSTGRRVLPYESGPTPNHKSESCLIYPYFSECHMMYSACVKSSEGTCEWMASKDLKKCMT